MARSRVRLALLRQQDMKPFLAATRASRSLHRPWVQPPLTAPQFRQFVRGIGEQRRRFLLWASPTGGGMSEVVGYFSLGEIVRGNLNGAYLGYWAVAPHAAQGFMTEGMQILLRWAFRRIRLHRVEANIQPGNERSIALARRAGFRLEGFSPRYLKVGGRWCDHERWAMTAEDWRALPAGTLAPTATENPTRSRPS
jgi:ribosomal-protein-alanine N-acetyltransferase